MRRLGSWSVMITPKFGGFQGGALIFAGEGGSEQFGLGGLCRDPLFGVKVAHASVKHAVPAGDRRDLLLAGDIGFGGPRLTAMYFQRKDNGVANKLSSVPIGGSLPIGPGDLRASYTRLEQGKGLCAANQ